MRHCLGASLQGLEVSQRQLGSISSKPAPTEQNESSPDLSTLGRAFLSQHYSGVSPEAVHGTTPQQQPQAQGSVVSQPVAPATVAEEPPPPDMPAYSAPEAAAVSAEQQPMQSFSQDATAEEMEEQQRFESQEMLPPDWGDPTAYRSASTCPCHTSTEMHPLISFQTWRQSRSTKSQLRCSCKLMQIGDQ